MRASAGATSASPASRNRPESAALLLRAIALVTLGVLLGAIPAVAAAARIAVLAGQRRRREETLRFALEARLWADRVAGAETPDLEAEALRGRRHEANNALSTALLSAQFLADASRDESGRSKPLLDQHVAAEELVEALQRMKGLFEPPRAATTTQPQASLVAPAPLYACAQASAARLRALHPRTHLAVELASRALDSASVAVCGGEAGLARVLDALLANACEGDGERRATRVVVTLGGEGEIDVVRVEVADDGPGFAGTQLEGRPEPFASRKPGHAGLGLYTAEHILAASGGSLRRENAAGGGAKVTAFLLASAERPR